MNGRALGERLVELIGWIAVAGGGAVIITQTFGWDGFRLLTTLQTLTPYLLPLLAIVGGIALFTCRHPLAAGASLVGVATLLLATPIAFPPGQAPMLEDATGVRAASINLLFSNPRVAAVGDDLLERDLDMIVFSEYTAEHQVVLLAHPLADTFPYRIERDGLYARGVAVWSKYPLERMADPETINYSVDLVVDGPDGAFRVLAVHPPTPVYNFEGWQRDLSIIADAASRPGLPTLAIGDFNASYWHPAFRDVLRHGLIDAHMANGAGWSTSWPTDEFVPPFVRLDHALTGNGLVSDDVDDFRVPGSDHAGFAITVAPAG